MGISSILGALSLLGFLLFLGGIATVVLSASQGRPVRSGVLLAIVGIIVGVLFSVISQGILIVQPQEVAVVVNTLTGDLDDNARRGGTHIIVPVVQQSFQYLVSQQSVTMDEAAGGEGPIVARTADGQEVSLDVSVLFSVDPANVNTLHLNWQGRYADEFVVPQTRGIVRDAVSGFEAADIYAGGREQLGQTAFDRLSRRLAADGLLLSDLIIRDVTFSQQYADAIEQAQVAAQEAEQARLRVQQRQQEAEQARAVAQGQADAVVIAAEGEASAIVARAQAEAQALQLVSEVLAANPNLIQYEYVRNLSDNVELILLPSNSPFLF
ncbi:MAG: prohibitin family protein, partial [Anaerolinea sp.]|nr:prohibitin family protein [Anaerolinea sp.]